MEQEEISEEQHATPSAASPVENEEEDFFNDDFDDIFLNNIDEGTNVFDIDLDLDLFVDTNEEQ